MKTANDSNRTTGGNDPLSNRRANYVLWTMQSLLAALFLFAGAMKFVLPVSTMTKQIPLPGAFLHFIGMAEILGALGLVLPWALRMRRSLTPIAALGLLIIMIGATTIMFHLGGFPAALMPLTVSVLLIIVARGRGLPLRQSSKPLRQQTSMNKHSQTVDFAAAPSTY